jgi:hypothetical protein
VDEIKENVTRQLMVILKEDFTDCFEKWKGCWDKCVISQGEYFEGDLRAIVLHRLLSLSLFLMAGYFPDRPHSTFKLNCNVRSHFGEAMWVPSCPNLLLPNPKFTISIHHLIAFSCKNVSVLIHHH